jgi:hypothetical protein
MSLPLRGRQKYVRFEASVAPDQIAFLNSEAARQRTSRNTILRKAIDYYRSFLSSISTDQNNHSIE